MNSPDDGLRKIHWSQVLPFVRLFNTFQLATNYTRLTLALLCVVSIYVAGRVVDVVWTTSGGGVRVLPDAMGTSSSIDAFALGGRGDDVYANWLSAAEQAYDRVDAEAAKLRKQINTEELDEAAGKVDTWRDTRREEIEKQAEGTAEERENRKTRIDEMARTLKFILAGKDPAKFGYDASIPVAVSALAPKNDVQDFEEVVRFRDTERRLAELEPRGPFITLLRYEMRCFAAGVQGVAAGRFGFGSAHSGEPGLCGSLVSAVKGVAWTVMNRPLFALIFGLIEALIFGLFGGAITRHAAVYLARDEAIGLTSSLAFAQEKLKEFVLAPVIPIGFMAVLALVLALGGLVGVVPVVDVIAGIGFFVAIGIGFVLTITLLGFLFGGHLMFPTVAVESSDAFDGITRAYGYVTQRPWHTAFYSLALLAYGGLCFIVVRLIAMLTLKLTHVFVGVGFNAWTANKLEATWKMPDWHELTLLPASGGTAFWGEFFSGPGDWFPLTDWLIALWVFIVVSLVAAFVVSFFYCGSTAMYLLLRRDVDATDYDEIYYEESEEELLAASTVAPVQAEGSLPVVETENQTSPSSSET